MAVLLYLWWVQSSSESGVGISAVDWTASWWTEQPSLLGRKACLGMRIVSYLDNDELNKPDTRGAPVYSVGESGPLSTQELIQQNPTVFDDGVGLLEGQYHIRLDERIAPVQHAPRCVPVPLQEEIQRTLAARNHCTGAEANALDQFNGHRPQKEWHPKEMSRSSRPQPCNPT